VYRGVQWTVVARAVYRLDRPTASMRTTGAIMINAVNISPLNNIIMRNRETNFQLSHSHCLILSELINRERKVQIFACKWLHMHLKDILTLNTEYYCGHMWSNSPI
jgi:hypothetical protein